MHLHGDLHSHLHGSLLKISFHTSYVLTYTPYIGWVLTGCKLMSFMSAIMSSS